MDENAVDRNGFFKRIKTCIGNELELFARCVCSASPDRSAAAVLFLVMFAASITCTSSRFMMESEPGRFPNYVVPWLIIGFEVVATVSLVLMWCYARNRRPDDDTSLQPWHRFLRRNIKLFGIVPFFFAIFVFDVFRLLANLTCIDAWRACSSDSIRVEHITDILYPVARTGYLCVELLVCVKFNAADFFQNTLVLVGLAIVQATNLSSWLDALIDESHVFLSERNWTYEISSCFNETDNRTDVNVSEHIVQCFKRETGEYELLEAASPYLFPFIMEYLLLVIECVADWFFSDAARHDATPQMSSAQPLRQTDGAEHAPLTSVADTNGNEGTELRRTTSYGSTQVEQQPQQGADATVSRASSSDSVLFDARGRQDETTPLIGGFVHVAANTRPQETWWFDRCPRLFFSVIMPSIASFLLLIFGIYNFYLGPNSYLNVFVCYRSSYWLALTLAALIGYTASRKFPSAPMNPNGFEYFVILSCIGPILQSIFTIVANVQTDGFVVPMGMFLTEEITNVIQICAQIVFYAYAKSIRLSTDERDVNECHFRRRRAILMGVISYYAVCNAALWVEDSFIDTRSSVKSWQRQYFENWPLIYNMFNPLSLMFRFNSFLLFLDVLFDKRRYH